MKAKTPDEASRTTGNVIPFRSTSNSATVSEQASEDGFAIEAYARSAARHKPSGSAGPQRLSIREAAIASRATSPSRALGPARIPAIEKASPPPGTATRTRPSHAILLLKGDPEYDLTTRPTLSDAIDELLDRATMEAPELLAPLTLASRLARAEPAAQPTPPARLNQAELLAFRKYTATHPWSGHHDLSPSQFIAQHYAKWLGKRDKDGNWIGRALWREDIAKVAKETKLAAAYATEIGRHPVRAVAGLYTQPHKLLTRAKGSSTDEPGATPGANWLPASALTEDQLAKRRMLGRERQERYRSKRKPSASDT